MATGMFSPNILQYTPTDLKQSLLPYEDTVVSAKRNFLLSIVIQWNGVVIPESYVGCKWKFSRCWSRPLGYLLCRWVGAVRGSLSLRFALSRKCPGFSFLRNLDTVHGLSRGGLPEGDLSEDGLLGGDFFEGCLLSDGRSLPVGRTIISAGGTNRSPGSEVLTEGAFFGASLTSSGLTLHSGLDRHDRNLVLVFVSSFFCSVIFHNWLSWP